MALADKQKELFMDLHNRRLEASLVVFSDPDFRGVWKTVVDKYPETAHFVYELLQNADDAEASMVEMILSRNELLFKHNGRKHFDISSKDAKKQGDINAITGIGNSTKEDASNKIGKFGVGFKAVFQYTNTPEIYDDVFKFKIEKYIIPVLLEEDHAFRQKGETLFVFPFKEPQKAYEDIVDRIENLNNPILFLTHLSEIKITIDDVTTQTYKYSKKILFTENYKDGINLQKVQLTSPSEKNTVFLFNKNISIFYKGEKSQHSIYVGFLYDDKNNNLITNETQNVFCFFPTKENFQTCYICHAPFLLTDNRQNLKPGEETNIFLIKSLAELAANAVLHLRDFGKKNKSFIINENLLDILPTFTPSSYYPYKYKHIWEEPIQEAFDNILENECIYLSRNNKYLPKCNAYLGTPKELIDLLSPTQLKELTRRDEYVDFLKWEMIKKLNEQERVLDAEYDTDYDSAQFARNITPQFMEHQDYKWVSKFYTFLRTAASKLWKVVGDESKKGWVSLPFRNAPIIKTQSGNWVSPYINNFTPNVFLPVGKDNTSEYNFIHEEYFNDKLCKKFFNELEIGKPDELDYIRQIILKRYLSDSGRVKIDDEVLVNDINYLLTYFINNRNKENELNSLLKNKFLLVSNANCLCSAKDLFINNRCLKQLYANKKELFVNDNFYSETINKFGYDQFIHFVKLLGVKETADVEIKIKEYYGGELEKELLQLEIKNQIKEKIIDRGIWAWRITDFNLPNFLSIIYSNNYNKELSIFIWNNILCKKDLDRYKYITLETKANSQRKFWRQNVQINSSLYFDLRNLSWLYNRIGEKVAAKNVFIEDLPSEYEFNQDVFNFLGLKRQEKSITELGGTLEQQESMELGRMIAEITGNNLSKEEICQVVKNAILEKKRHDDYGESKTNQNPTKKSSNRNNSFEDFNPIDDTDEESTSDFEDENDVEFDSRDEMPKVNLEEMFLNVVSPKEDTDNEEKEEKIDSEEEDIQQEIEEEKAKQDRIAELRNIVEISERYSKEWFEALLELEHKACNIVDKDSPKAININFTRVNKESDRIYILSDSSRGVPTWLEEVGNIEVNFSFSDREDSKIKFEVANVRDFSLRLKASNVYKEKLSIIDWAKCTKASISIKNQLDLTSKLLTAFRALNLPDGYNLKENLSSNLNFIFGPPGTGKTTRLADNIIRLMSDKNRHKILVLAPTNTACDELARKIKEKRNGLDCSWLARFVATSDVQLEKFVVDRDSLIYKKNQCCVISTMARLCFDGFDGYNLLKDIDWDLIICDEASMIPLADIAHAIYNFQSSCPILIAGDPMQICPIVQEPEWKDENIYSMIKLDRFDNPKTEPIQFRIENLGMQYRSLPPIGELFSQYAYNGKLKHYRSMMNVPKHKFGKLLLKPINFMPFKVERFDSIFGAKKLDGSNVHLYSVLLTVETCKYVAKQYAKINDDIFTIGIICPYAPQARLIENLIAQSTDIPDNISITIGTVHRFQGGQCNLIFAVFNPPRGLKVATEKVFLNNKNIVNVAISRAQDYLCILLPHCETDGYNKLYELNQIGLIAQKDSANVQTYTCDEIEEIIYGKKFYIENNTFVTSHQLANVYTKPIKKFEIRIDESSVDIQLGGK
jgi:hypothetical protein